MWLKKLDEIFHIKRLRKDDIAIVGEMSRNGFRQALESGSLRFDVMIRILKHYNIDYYELVEEEYQSADEFKGKYQISHKDNEDVNKLLELLKQNYENTIKQYIEHNEILKGQIQFLQQVISKNQGLEGITSHAM
ncbi:MAG: hypothetical protein ACOYOV_11125 [Bacteroidales bacterium]